MYSKASLYLHTALFAGQGGRCDPQAYHSLAATGFAQALNISRLEELDCMPTDMDEYGEYSNSDCNNGCSENNLQPASTTVPAIFTGQMDAYYATAAQVSGDKAMAHYMSSAVGHSQGAAAAITVASAGQSLNTLEAYARCDAGCLSALLLPCRQLTVRSARGSTLTKSMSWLGLRAAESAAPLHFTRDKFSVKPFNTWPGAAPAACYGTLDDYDDIDDAPWALRYGIDPNLPPEPAAPRCACPQLLLLSAPYACTRSQHGGLPECGPLPPGQHLEQAQPQHGGCRQRLHRACQRVRAAPLFMDVWRLSTAWWRTGPRRSPSLAARLASARCIPW